MTDRSVELADAAIRVLASAGARALTHRAVDAEAGLPSGSTSNVFRSRSALIAAAVDLILERDLLRLRAAAAEDPPTPGALAAAFVARTLRDATPDVLARSALTADPDAAALRRGRDAFLRSGDGLLAADPAPATRRLVVALVDGVLLDSALHGVDHDPGTIAAAVDAVIGAAPKG